MSVYNYFGTVNLPDGRAVSVRQEGYFDHSTGAFEETGLVLEWPDGEELTADEQNELVAPRTFLHEYCVKHLLDAPDFHEEPFIPEN